MLLITKKLTPKCKVPINFNLFLVSCDHEGSILRHKKGWEQCVDHINSSIDGLPIKANRVVHHGDLIDAIDPLDARRYDADTVEGTYLQQIQYSIANMMPIAWALVSINEGNHTWKKRNLGKATEYICKEISQKCNTPVIYGTWSSKITFLNFRSELLFKHYARHGIRSISSTSPDPVRRDAYKKFRLRRLLENQAGDCVLMSRGHTHEMILCEPIKHLYLMDDGDQLHQAFTKSPHDAEYIDPDLRWYVSPGSFLKTQMVGVSGYADIGEYEPILLGYCLVKIRNGKIETIEKITVD